MKSKRRVLKAEEKSEPWFVELPQDRPVKRTIISEKEWERVVGRLATTDQDRLGVCQTIEGPVRVGSSEWKDLLRHYIVSTGSQMFWERPRTKKRSFISRDADGHPVINTLFGVLRGGTPEYAAFLDEQRRERHLRSRRRR